ncbi:sphingosine N-acyltransferase lag1 [Lecanora helva]
MPAPRRRSSNLGGELRGDTGVSALSTLEPTPTFISPPLTPTKEKERNSQKPPRQFSKRRKAKSLFRRWKQYSFRHTWLNPLILILITLSAYAINPTESNPIHRALFLSYPLAPDHPFIPYYARDAPRPLDWPLNFNFINAPTYYGKGNLDYAFVSFYIIVMTFSREFLMQRLLRPMAISYGIKSRAKQNRYMEQMYTAIYFAVFGPFGLFVMSRTPIWYFNTVGMYEGFPHRAHEGLFKLYYLLQASYWAQQFIVLVLQLEKPRKDFKELVGHHIVTLALIALSYRFHFTYMGLAVYITHDISDFFLARNFRIQTSKSLSYVDSSYITPYFTFFMGIWIYLRHYCNIVILYATLTTFKDVGPFDLNWETQQYKCWISQYITFSLLAALQGMNLFWLYFILRIAYNMAFKDVAQDVRSDDEESDEEVEEKEGMEKKAMLNGKPKGANGKALEGHSEKAEARFDGIEAR